jgi:D-alanine-D-alanine ligase
MSERKRIIVIYGGKSGEHEISLRSAATVLSHLDQDKYDIIPIGMDAVGQCYVNPLHELIDCTTELPVATKNATPLPSLFVDGHLAISADVVFPVVHGPLYEDGAFQGLLELANVAYVGCPVLASAIGMDKDMARRLIHIEGIQSARYELVSCFHNEAERESIYTSLIQTLGFPLFVKPTTLGSSVGIHKVNSLAALREAVMDALNYDISVIVEEFIQGREIELAVLENANPAALPLVTVAGEIKVNHPDGFYSYAAKYLDSEASELCIPAQLPKPILERLQHAAQTLFKQLKCRGMARVDFFVNDETGRIDFNEINTIPGFTSISMYPKLWEVSGLALPDLLDKLIGLALTYHQAKQKRVTKYQ